MCVCVGVCGRVARVGHPARARAKEADNLCQSATLPSSLGLDDDELLSSNLLSQVISFRYPPIIGVISVTRFSWGLVVLCLSGLLITHFPQST